MTSLALKSIQLHPVSGHVEKIGVLEKSFAQHTKMCEMILKVSMSMRKSIESVPDVFLSLNLLRAVVNSTLVNCLSGDVLKCKS